MRKVLIVSVSLLAVACGSYRYVRRTPDGGTIALQGDREEAMKKAEKAMANHCRGPYYIVEEGEAVVGEDTYASAESGRTRSGTQRTNASSTTRDRTEWRVTYSCGAGNADYPGTEPAYTPDGMGGGPTSGEPPPGQTPGNY